jgi:tRNA(fMet)-specific endonuclease VapC
MNYFLDTNIFIMFTQRKDFRTFFNNNYNHSQLVTSVVVEGELKSFSIQRKWGFHKRNTLSNFLSKSIIYPIKTELIIDKYAEIDAYSQGKHPTIQLPTSARNMGKNDIWIAATASVLNITLLTTDKDFDHLNNVFLTVEWIDLKKLG